MKHYISQQPETVKLDQLLSELNGESERGVALVSSAYLEEILGKLLLAFLADTKEKTALVKGHGPLSTFYSRILACSALGLIEPSEVSIIETVRVIRNEFAHKWKDISFTSKKVVNLIQKLPSTGHEDLDNEPYLKYKMIVASLLTRLLWRERLVEKKQIVLEKWPNKE